FSDHAVMNIELFVEATVLAVKPLEISCIFDGKGGDVAECGDELQQVRTKARAWGTCLKVQNAEHDVANLKRDREDAMNPTFHQGFGFAVRMVGLEMARKNG